MKMSIFRLVVLLYFGMASIHIIAANTENTDEKKTRKSGKVYLYGEVMDVFTKGRIQAFITLMKSDSTVVDTVTNYLFGTNSSFGFVVPKQPTHYIIKAEKDGYETSYTNYDFQPNGRNNLYKLPNITLKRKASDVYKNVDLDGVVVKGTRIQVVQRGDTIIYDASAFNLPEGSMLDALVRQLPGAEIKSNGDIYINGKKLDYLTLNGRDFFKGDNKQMLDNLPYFTVKNLKVFHKSTEASKRAGIDLGQKEYVMDVTLKRQYARGYIANVEAGGGTNERWTGRLFGLYYDDHNSVTLFGNANNVNEDRRPGQKGDWSPEKQPKGVLTTKEAGLNVHNEDKDKKVESDFEALVKWSKADNESNTIKDLFAEGGNLLSGSQNKELSDNLRASFSHKLNFSKLGLYHDVHFIYMQNTTNETRKDSTGNGIDIMNRQLKLGHSKYQGISVNGYIEWYKQLPWGDHVIASFDYKYTNIKPYDRFGKLMSEGLVSGTADNRNLYINNQQRNYQYEASLGYILGLSNLWFLHADFNYVQNYQNLHNDYFRLDRLAGFADRPMGVLPSTNDSLLMAVDVPNNFLYNSLKRTYQGKITINKSDGKKYIQFELPISREVERMHFTGCGLDTIANRRYTRVNPNFMWVKMDEKFAQLKYDLSVDVPEFNKLMPITITANPLYTTIYNPNLKKRITHTATAYLTWAPDSVNTKTTFMLMTHFIHNKWGSRCWYDSRTYAYTTMDDNVNGNWDIVYNSWTEGSFDKNKRLKYELTLNAQYTRSVDFAITFDQQPTELSKVNTIITGIEPRLYYSYDKLTVGINGKLASQHSRSHQDNFMPINVYDFRYGMNLQCTIPIVNLNVFTDINMFSRRGYQSSEMNTNDLIWNIQLTRSFAKGKLTAKLQAYDLLHQLSNKEYKVDAQGRTEIWYNSVPNYWMLSLAYKFVKTPKK